MNCFKKSLFIVFLLLIPFLLSGERLVVVRLKPIGVDPSVVEATTTLLRDDLSAYSQYSIVGKSEMESVTGVPLDCEDIDCAQEIGSQLNCDKVVYGTLSKLGEKYIISVNVIRVADKKVVFQDRISVTSIEDIDISSKRLAKSIATGKKVEKTAEIGIITEEETKEPRRRLSYYTAGGKFGWSKPLGDSYGGVSSLISYDFVGWYETQNFIVEAMFGWNRSSGYMFLDTAVSASEFYPELSLLYLFSKGDFCPFVGGGVGMRFLTMDKDFFEMENATAFGFNFGGGLIIFRTYDFRILIDGRYSHNFAELDTYGGPHNLVKVSFGITYSSSTGGCGGACGTGGCF